MNKSKTILYTNFFSFIYFIALIGLSYYPVESQLLNIIGELITIPLLLFLLFSLGYSIVNIAKGVRSKFIFKILSLSAVTIGLLVIVTIIQIG